MHLLRAHRAGCRSACCAARLRAGCRRAHRRMSRPSCARRRSACTRGGTDGCVGSRCSRSARSCSRTRCCRCTCSKPRYRLMMQRCLDGDSEFGVVLIERGSEVGGGDVALRRRHDRADRAGGRAARRAVYASSTIGLRRFRVVRWLRRRSVPASRGRKRSTSRRRRADDERMRDQAFATFGDVLELWHRLDDRVPTNVPPPSDDPVRDVFEIAATAPLGPLDAQRVLEAAARRRVGSCCSVCSTSCARNCARVSRSSDIGSPVGARRPRGYRADMTQFDDEDARERLEAERERVNGLIEELRERRSRPVGGRPGRRALALRPASRRHRVGHVRTREGSLDPRATRSRPRRDRGRVATPRRRHATASTRSPARRSIASASRRSRPRARTSTRRTRWWSRLRLFAAAREAAGPGTDTFDRTPRRRSVTLLARGRASATARDFVAVLATARVWVNGDEPAAGAATVLREGDEVAVLPPVSGGT